MSYTIKLPGEDAAPEGRYSIKLPDAAPPEDATAKGRAYAKEATTGPALLNALNGLTFGFGDEIAGGVTGIAGMAAGLPYKQGYESGRDYVRGAVDEHRKQYPAASTIGTIGGALLQAPAIPIKALGGAGLLARAATGAGYGAGFGALQGAGDASSIDTMMEEAAGGGIKGAVLGGALPVAGAAAGGAISAVGSRLPSITLPPAIQTIADKLGLRFDGAMSEQLALRQIGQAMARQGKTGAQVEKELAALGGEARTADAVGLDVLDTMANLPGKTRDAAAAAIRERQITRPDRLEAVSTDMAGTATKGKDIVRDLTDYQKMDAAPLYAKVDKARVPITDKLANLAERPVIQEAMEQARTNIKNSGKTYVDEFNNAALNDNSMTLRFWDDVKRGLDDVIYNTKRGVSNKSGSTIKSAQEAKQELLRELDTLTSKSGKREDSFYYKARDAYAGPAAIKDKIEEGRKIFSMSEQQVEETLFKASQSELEGFRLGAADAWRDKVGTRGGISSVLAAPFEKKTQMMLKSVFGDEAGYKRAMATLENEGKMRQLESVTGGSPTARRLANQEDAASGVIEDAANAAVSATGGHIAGVIRAGRSLAGRLGTPEVVRDEIGKMLLMKGGDTLRGKSRAEIMAMVDEVAKSIAMGNSQAAAISGVLGGSIPLR